MVLLVLLVLLVARGCVLAAVVVRSPPALLCGSGRECWVSRGRVTSCVCIITTTLVRSTPALRARARDSGKVREGMDEMEVMCRYNTAGTPPPPYYTLRPPYDYN